MGKDFKLEYAPNWANRLLVFLLVLFAGTLYGKIVMPNPMWNSLQIVVEAALVGGLADWFAVTALFRKPLGFPYHTALLPRKRKAFVNGTIKLLRQELVGRKKLYNVVEGLSIQPYLQGILQNKKISYELTRKVMQIGMDYLTKLDSKQVVNKILCDLRLRVESGEKFPVMEKLVLYIISNPAKEKILDTVLKLLTIYFNKPYREKSIAHSIKTYVDAKHGGFLLNLAYSTNIFNPDELGTIITNYSRDFLKLSRNKNEYLYGQLLVIVEDLQIHLTEEFKGERDAEVLGKIIKDNSFLALLLAHPMTTLCCEAICRRIIDGISIKSELLRSNYNVAILDPMLSKFSMIVNKVIVSLLVKLAQDEQLFKRVEHLIKEFLHRGAIGGERWIVEIVREFMEKLGKDELNALVYPKVRKDLIWIRLNGSIVGGLIGMIFVLGKAIFLS